MSQARGRSDYVLTQVPVLNQFTTEGSPHASCGMHALRNALLLADSEQLSEELLLPSAMQDMFQKWAGTIRTMRFKPLITECLAEKIKMYYQGARQISENQENYQIAQTLWSNVELEAIIASKVFSVLGKVCSRDELLHENSDHYSSSLSCEKIYSYYEEAMHNNARNNTKERKTLDEFLASRDTFNLLFSEFTIEAQFAFTGEVLINGEPQKAFKVEKDWLESSEIERLFELETALRQDDLNTPCLFYGPRISVEEMKTFREIRSSLEQNNDLSAIILICTSGQGMFSSLFNSAHWFTLVLRASHGKSRYIVADSISQDRLVDPRVQVIVDYLEGKRNTLELPKQDIPILAIVGVVGGAVCVIIRKLKNASEKKSVQRPSCPLQAVDTSRPFILNQDSCKDGLSVDGGRCEAGDTDHMVVDHASNKPVTAQNAIKAEVSVLG